jgi:hypothetical protein
LGKGFAFKPNRRIWVSSKWLVFKRPALAGFARPLTGGWSAELSVRRLDTWLEDSMVRFLKVLVLWCLFSIAGLATVASGTWALAAVEASGLMMPFLVLGLASVLPVSLAVADNVVPRAHHGVWPSASCSYCGAPFGHGLGPKPDPESWPFL